MIYAVTLYIETEDIEDIIHFLDTIETENLVDFEVNRADIYENEENDDKINKN